jgi:hypothetical protein
MSYIVTEIVFKTIVTVFCRVVTRGHRTKNPGLECPLGSEPAVLIAGGKNILAVSATITAGAGLVQHN